MPEPGKYYAFSQEWTHTDAPNYHDRNSFSKTWAFASKADRTLFSDRQSRTANATNWAMNAALKAFKTMK